MKNNEPEKKISVELDDDELDNVSGGFFSAVDWQQQNGSWIYQENEVNDSSPSPDWSIKSDRWYYFSENKD